MSLRWRVPVLVLAFQWVPGATEAQEAELAGMIDLHVHVAPDSRGPRSVNGFEAAQMARRHGIRALLIKNHYTETASQAYLVSQIVPDIGVYGGIVLNRSVGGINPVAVGEHGLHDRAIGPHGLAADFRLRAQFSGFGQRSDHPERRVAAPR